MDPTWAQLAQAQGAVNVVIDSRPLGTALDNLPNVPERGALIFRSWAQALRFIGSARTRLGQLQLLGSLTVPAGAWDLRGMTIASAVDPSSPLQGGSQATLTIPTGVTLVNCAGFRGLQVVQTGAGPVITYAGASTVRLGLVDTTLTLGDGCTFAAVTETAALQAFLDSSVVQGGGSSTDNRRFIDVSSATASAAVLMQGGPSVMAYRMLRCAGSNDLQLQVGAGTLVEQQPDLAMSATAMWQRRLWPAPWITPAVLVPEQLAVDGDQLMIRQATVVYYVSGANFTAGNTISITDGTSTETWTAVAGAPGAGQFQIGATAGESLQAWCARVAATSTLWTAAEPEDLGLGVTAPCVIMRRDQDRAGYPDRIYATTTPVLGVLNFSRAAAYGTYAPRGDLNWPQYNTPLTTTDPGGTCFGWGENNAPGGFFVAIVDNLIGWIYKSNKANGGTSSWISSDAYGADAGSWAAPAPTTMSEAITRIAAAVDAGLAGPIAL